MKFSNGNKAPAGIALLSILLGTGTPDAKVRLTVEVAMSTIHADASWYKERSEPTKAWFGRLRPREKPYDPFGRGGLNFELAMKDDKKLPIYSVGAQQELQRFESKDVVVCGKLINFPEDPAEELWIGTIGIATPEQAGNDACDEKPRE